MVPRSQVDINKSVAVGCSRRSHYRLNEKGLQHFWRRKFMKVGFGESGRKFPLFFLVGAIEETDMKKISFHFGMETCVRGLWGRRKAKYFAYPTLTLFLFSEGASQLTLIYLLLLLGFILKGFNLL